MRHREHRHATRVRQFDHLFDRVNCAQYIRYLGNSNQFRAIREQARELVKEQVAGLIDRGNPDRRAGMLAGHQSGDDVRVMLHLRQQNLVTGLEQPA